MEIALSQRLIAGDVFAFLCWYSIVVDLWYSDWLIARDAIQRLHAGVVVNHSILQTEVQGLSLDTECWMLDSRF